jgi:hypothetical protein
VFVVRPFFTNNDPDTIVEYDDGSRTIFIGGGPTSGDLAQWGLLLMPEGRAPKPSRKVPGQWRKVNEAMSPRARAYQQQITGRSGEAYFVGGVKFDGIADGVLLDAKGPGYSNFVKDGKFRSWFNGQKRLLKQARDQLQAACGRPIRWDVAEADAATAIRRLLADNNIVGIDVVHTPVVP